MRGINAHSINFQDIVGMDVYGSNDKKIGAVDQVFEPRITTVQPHAEPYLCVKSSGLLSSHEYFVPAHTISSIEPERVVLSVTEGDIKHQDWDALPEDFPG